MEIKISDPILQERIDLDLDELWQCTVPEYRASFVYVGWTCPGREIYRSPYAWQEVEQDFVRISLSLHWVTRQKPLSIFPSYGVSEGRQWDSVCACISACMCSMHVAVMLFLFLLKPQTFAASPQLHRAICVLQRWNENIDFSYGPATSL